jgi:ATP adenylyltransferase
MARRDGHGNERGVMQLWAPWRSAYISRAASGGQRCIFCVGELSAAERRSQLVLHQDADALVMLNRYPYNNGHLMVAPRRHIATPELLTEAERALLAELVSSSIERLRKALSPAGFNVGANIGRIAGAGFAEHLHWHVVPRWDGDTNFMPVLSGTRVISQHLKESFRMLAPLFKGIRTAIS